MNAKAINLFKELMDLTKVKFDIKKFTNPKLEKCIAHIEALALDEKLGSLPPDSTGESKKKSVLEFSFIFEI